MYENRSAKILHEMLKIRINDLKDKKDGALKLAFEELRAELLEEPEFDTKLIPAEILHEIANTFGISIKDLFKFPSPKADNDSN